MKLRPAFAVRGCLCSVLAVAAMACSSSAPPGTGFPGDLGGSSSGSGSSGTTTSSSGGTASGSSSGGGGDMGAGSGSGSGSGGGGLSSGGGGSGTSSGSSSSSGGSGSHGGSTSSGGSSGGGGSSGAPVMGRCAEMLPALSDYSTNGPFTASSPNGSAGPGSAYTVVQPTTLGTLNGKPFKHPIITWGNGITTTPSYYTAWFDLMASNGFVVIASNSSSVTVQNMTDGLDWMVQQNSTSGPYQGMLDTTCLFTVGYSLGGQGAVGSGSHADVVATVAIHPAGGSPAGLKGPLLLFTADTDTVCTAATFVLPVFQSSPVQSFYADLSKAGDPNNYGHITPVISPGLELSGTMAWLRLWAYGDQGAKSFFWGSGAKLCQSPWQCQSRAAGGAAQMSGF